MKNLREFIFSIIQMPSSPVNKIFVRLPGVVDISISGSVMYADSYVDLVVLDVQDVDRYP